MANTTKFENSKNMKASYLLANTKSDANAHNATGQNRILLFPLNWIIAFCKNSQEVLTPVTAQPLG
jgi:hypothetical protein